ncbi:putative LRR receptor-like serine/threonine-protein kinase [Prunus yedoensis var. nudiflora]|uniref:non-specific serine/threonine protein kinase n=1 Tax=Prunus yedoensis var. nudiflora TaxID=2094558 RepID=A0A314UCS9_PRUYE|nr:putative LRR receptor-like serine/threonine-protein kinase [Prunus yedoensis var. nudiflora]
MVRFGRFHRFGRIDAHPYQPPSVVMSTASTPKDPSDSLSIIFLLPDINAEYYSYLHFAEVERLQVNQSRLQYFFRNGRRTFGPFAPPQYLSYTIHSIGAWSSYAQYANISITRAENSTLPPILNAFEIYMVKKFIEAETSEEDVDAIAYIKSTYKIRIWQGDPCAPQHFVWEGVKCKYQDLESPRIISLNLSSSGLTGEIAASISNLTMIQSLDLSNNLTGPIPYFLSKLPNLTVLNLEKNKFTGSIPVGLIERKNNGFLSLSLCDNAHLSRHVSCILKKKHSFVIPIVVSIAGIFILLLVVAAICWWGFKTKRQHGDAIDAKAIPQYGSLESTKRQFTYSEILKMTDTFERVLGRGGFGTVYHGYMDHTQVAIKMLSASSVQGFQQFHAEVNLLMRVHHKNMTSLVGYCNDETKVGLVYEYMANGNLLNHLSDSRSSILTWEDRLRIATDAAQGLEYLHCGCKPPMMHRDVKSTNILLNESFQAKISDFGLSRNFPTHDGTHASSLLAGTPGYLDPEFYLSNRLNEKSDVYSFGIVLLEIITSRPVLTRTQERIHISQWVGFMLANGDINSIVDPRLEGNFNTNSVWKAVEIAMTCVSINAIKRPSMSQVMVDLKECLATECARTNHSRVDEFNNFNELMADNSIVRLTPSVR